MHAASAHFPVPASACEVTESTGRTAVVASDFSIVLRSMVVPFETNFMVCEAEKFSVSRVGSGVPLDEHSPQVCVARILATMITLRRAHVIVFDLIWTGGRISWTGTFGEWLEA
jgi:hypothetical protein